jgi:hypothetical protein
MRAVRTPTTLALTLIFGSVSPAFANDPLSAIEWLEKRPKQIVVPLAPTDTPKFSEPAVASAVKTPEITTTPLGAPVRAAAGLLPSAVTGLPNALWHGSDAQTLDTLITALNVEDQPALQALFYTLLLAEADPPEDAKGANFMRARVTKLLDLGALDPASALLERSDPAHIDLFDLYFDTSLLGGDAEQPCNALRAQPSLSRDLERRIFCDAQNQAWDSAALTLSTADAIGAIAPVDVTLWEHFLDPELFSDVPAIPDRPTVLQFRLFQAIGEALPTRSLPRAFAATDLTGNTGWKVQLDAAERLARVGAISENRLLGIYTSRIPSASGGIWDRAEAIQRLETALAAGDPVGVFKQLRRAWSKMQENRLEVPFATLFSDALMRLLSPKYESAAQRVTSDPTLKVAQSIAVGEPKSHTDVALSATLVAAFSGDGVPQHLTDMSKNTQLGEAILRAMALTQTGVHGDPSALQSGLAFLRSVGLEDTARRTALQLLLIDKDDRG